MSAPRLTEGSVRRQLARLALPMVGGILAMMTFYVADTWFVARLGADALAAMSFTFPVVTTLMSIGIGLMAGTSSILARVIGEGDPDRVRRLTTDALALSVLISVALAAIGLATLEPLFRLLGAPDRVLPLIGEYMRLWYLGVPLLIVPMVGLGAIRATGDARIQSATMTGAAALNLVLDPLLIFGLAGFPRMELAGAALATLVARAASLVVGAWALHWRFRMLSLEAPGWPALRASWARVLHVGLPAAGTNAIIPVANGVVVAILAGFGATAVAGFGAASRVEGLVLVPFYALSAVIGPFVGQNLGAGRHERIAEAMRACAWFCVAAGVVMAVGLGLFAEPLIGLFAEDGEVVRAGAAYLTIVPVSYAAAGAVMVVNAAFNGIGRPLPAVVVSAGRMLVLYVPGAALGAWLAGPAGAFTALAAANLVAGTAGLAWFRANALAR